MKMKTYKNITSAVKIEDLENKKKRIKAFTYGMLTGLTIFYLYVIIKTIVFIFSETNNNFKKNVNRQSQCYTYQNSIEELKGELVSGNPDVINKFNNLINKFNQLNCPQMIFFNDNYNTENKAQ